MADVFLSVVNMSIAAGYAAIAVIIIRFLLRSSPKWISVALWGVVGLRLILPFSLKSVFSLIPTAKTFEPSIMTDPTPSISTGIPAINEVVNPIIGSTFAPKPYDSANPLQIIIPVLAVIWLMGIIALLIYAFISYTLIKHKTATAVRSRDNIYQSENVASPFILGIFRPRIYLPFKISEKDADLVIAHEVAHIKRKDHLWKPIGFLLLALHWFNPIMWVAYILLCRDIVLACDEKVVKKLSREERADYSNALLSCSTSRRAVTACPLAFGEVGIKQRIRSVLNYKKPTFWVILIACIASIALVVCFLTDPPIKPNMTQPGGNGQYETDPYGIYSARNFVIQVKKVGCDIENVSFTIRRVRFENSHIILDTHWENNSESMITIGPDFEMYKHNGERFEKMESKGVWLLYKQFLSGKGMGVNNGDELDTIATDDTTTYDLSANYDCNGAGLYRFEAHGAWVEYELYNSWSELYSSYDASNGLDVYVWQMAPESYSFGLLPHSDEPRYWLSSTLLSMYGVNADTMAKILKSYNLSENEIYIIPWQNPISSYIAEPWIIREGEDMEQKKEDYIKKIKDMLF